MSDPIEPWLRGPLAGVHPLLCPLIYSFQQASEDLRKWTEGLTTEQVWARPHGLAPLGFQIRHIGGSVERLMTYVFGGQLSERQMNDLANQMEAGAGLDELLAQMERRFADAEAKVRAMDSAMLDQPRQVGRKRLPTTVGGLLTHIAEHMQRHVGQAIVTAKIVRV
jgi:DinB family protein